MIPAPKFHGPIVPLVTPFTSTFELDEPAAVRLVESLAVNGVGVFVLGTTGEAASVLPSLRRRLVEIAVATAAGRVPVFAGIGDSCVQTSVDSGRDFLRLGVDALVALLPTYFVLTPAEMQAYFALLARELHGPLVIYNFPPATGMSIPLDVIEPLAADPAFIGLKDSEATPGRLEETALRFGGRPGFAIFIGVAALSMAALQKGFDGCVPSSGNLVPDLWREFFACARVGDWAATAVLQARTDAISRVFQRNRTLGGSLAALKAGLASRGLCGPTVLPPLRTFDAAECEAVRGALVDLLPPLPSAPRPQCPSPAFSPSPTT